eukprot:SAG31_NODE_11509_length_1022_cov_1.426869_1_plen_75_part_00
MGASKYVDMALAMGIPCFVCYMAVDEFVSAPPLSIAALCGRGVSFLASRLSGLEDRHDAGHTVGVLLNHSLETA